MLLCEHRHSAACTQPGWDSFAADRPAAHIHDHHSGGGGVRQQLAAKQRRGAAVGLGGWPRQVGQAVQWRNLLLHGGGGLGGGSCLQGWRGVRRAAGGRRVGGGAPGAAWAGRAGALCNLKDSR